MMPLRLYGVFAVLALTTPLAAQQAAGSRPAPAPSAAAMKAPEDYIIGDDDVLTIVFWREKEMSSEVTVRPDGKITLPLINDVVAAGLTPEQLRVKLTTDSARFIEDPSVSVVVKTINSRKIFITGQVSKPGPYALGGPTTVLQFIATAGGVAEYADLQHIVILRHENGKATSLPFNYKDVKKGKKLQQNIELKPGDTVVVP